MFLSGGHEVTVDSLTCIHIDGHEEEGIDRSMESAEEKDD